MWWYMRMQNNNGIGATRRNFIATSSAPARCSAVANRSRAPIERTVYQMLWCGRVFAVPGIALLVIFVLARPQEFVPLLPPGARADAAHRRHRDRSRHRGRARRPDLHDE